MAPFSGATVNRTHGISEGRGTSLHVYTKIAGYFEEYLPAGGRWAAMPPARCA